MVTCLGNLLITWPVLMGVTVAMGSEDDPGLHGVGDSSWRFTGLFVSDCSDFIFSTKEGVGGRSTSDEEASRLRDASSQLDQSLN